MILEVISTLSKIVLFGVFGILGIGLLFTKGSRLPGIGFIMWASASLTSFVSINEAKGFFLLGIIFLAFAFLVRDEEKDEKKVQK